LSWGAVSRLPTNGAARFLFRWLCIPSSTRSLSLLLRFQRSFLN